MMTQVIAIHQLADCDTSLVGGKALALGRMYRAGVTVPETVCITSDAYLSFIETTGIRDKILLEIDRKEFGEMRWEELWDCSLRIRNLFLTTYIPTELKRTIVAAIDSKFGEKSVAVRSSAPGEDSANLSFAGLHESYLDISGSEGILDHIRLVWASLFSDRALLYRRELKLDPRSNTMAVLIQEMVFGASSGIAFSRNPVSPEQTVIESIQGLNQNLVDGKVEPFRWILDKRTGGILTVHKPQVNDSESRSATGETPSTLPFSNIPLNEEKIREIFLLVNRMEMLFGSPQDMEWTYADSILVALQSRPITAAEYQLDDERRWYLTLRRSFSNLTDLQQEIEHSVIPLMEKEARLMGALNLTEISNEELYREIQARKSVLEKWEAIYKEKCIPFAHAIRLFAEVYNDHMQPESAFEFTDLLSGHEMLSVKRNDMIKTLAELMRNDPESLACLIDGHPERCAEVTYRLIEQFKNEFGDVAWGKDLLFNNSANLASLIEKFTNIGANQGERKGKTKESESRFLSSFPAHQKEYASSLLEMARASYRLRDDDNIYVGKIKGRVVDAEREAIRRGMFQPEDNCNGVSQYGLPCRQDSEPLSQHFQQSGTPDLQSRFRMTARQVVGQPAGLGLATGKARIIAEPSDLFNFCAGEVLVCDAIDPNMTFIVPLAAAIVERRGGMLIHGAIIAREYGIPCVTGVPRATEIIKSGDIVTVDGFLGIVVIG